MRYFGSGGPDRPALATLCTVRLLALAALLAGCEGEIGDIDEPGIAFRPMIQADLEMGKCASCHTQQGSTPMKLYASPATDVEWLANYREVRARAGTLSGSSLIDMAVGIKGHGKSFSVDGPVISRWRRWVGSDAPFTLANVTSPPDVVTGASKTSWEADIAPLLQQKNCLSCHSGAGARGRYGLDSYQAALASGSDSTPNVLAGDSKSLLVTYCKNGHYINSGDAAVVTRWVVDAMAREK